MNYPAYHELWYGVILNWVAQARVFDLRNDFILHQLHQLYHVKLFPPYELNMFIFESKSVCCFYQIGRS